MSFPTKLFTLSVASLLAFSNPGFSAVSCHDIVGHTFHGKLGNLNNVSLSIQPDYYGYGSSEIRFQTHDGASTTYGMLTTSCRQSGTGVSLHLSQHQFSINLELNATATSANTLHVTHFTASSPIGSDAGSGDLHA